MGRNYAPELRRNQDDDFDAWDDEDDDILDMD